VVETAPHQMRVSATSAPVLILGLASTVRSHRRLPFAWTSAGSSYCKRSGLRIRLRERDPWRRSLWRQSHARVLASRGELETAARSSGARLHTPAAVGQLGNRVALVRGRLGPLGDGPQSIGWLNRDSSAEYPETSDEDDEGE
jgi:hypothetical protein